MEVKEKWRGVCLSEGAGDPGYKVKRRRHETKLCALLLTVTNANLDLRRFSQLAMPSC